MYIATVLLCFVFCSFFMGISADDGCTDPLQCYLNDLELVVPDQCFPVNEDGDEFCLDDFTCHGFYIGNINSSYSYDKPTSLPFGVLDFATDCTGRWRYQLLHGRLDANVTNTDILVDFYVTKDQSTMLPTQLEFDQCDLATCNIDLTFEGSLTSVVLEVVSPLIERVLKTAIYDILCVKVADLLYYNATSAIVDNLDPKLVEIMASTASTPPELPASGYISWTDSIVSKVHSILDRFRNASSSLSPQNFLSCMNSTRDLSLINTVIQKITNGTGDIAVPLGNISLGNLSVTGLTISGLDSLSNVGVMVPSEENPQLMATTLSLEELTVDISMALNMYEYQENSSFVIRVSNVALVMDLFLAVNQAKMQALHVSQLSEMACVGEAVDYFNITDLTMDMSVDLISIIELGGVAGELEADIVAYLDNIMLLITNGFGDLLSSVITGAFQGPLRVGINNQVNALLTDGVCPPYVPVSTTDLIVWANSTVVKAVDKVFDEMLGPEGLNSLMTCVTNGTGAITIANLTNEYTRVVVSGLNSFYELSLLFPVPNAPYSLATQLGLGQCDRTSGDPADCNPFSIALEGNFILRPDQLQRSLASIVSSPAAAMTYTLDSLLVLVGDAVAGVNSNTAPQFDAELELRTDGTTATTVTPAKKARSSRLEEVLSEYSSPVSYSDSISDIGVSAANANMDPVPIPDTLTYMAVTLENFDIHVSTTVEMNHNAIGDLQLSQLSTTGCVPSTMTAAAIEELSINVTEMDILVQNETRSFNITPLVQGIFDKLGSPERLAQKNKQYAEDLSASAATCENGGVTPSAGGDGDLYTESWKWEISLLVGGCLVILVAFLFFFGRWGRNKRKGCLGVGFSGGEGTTRMRYDEHGQPYESGSMTQGDEEDLSLWEEIYWTYGFEHALAFHRDLPLWFRAGVVVSILACMALFINSNSDPEAVVVMANIYAGDVVIHSPPVFAFGLAGTVSDMWEAKVYALSILIAFFSGAWPYIKLCSMLAMWVLPPAIVSPSTRENVFIWLDILGKWSLIDVNVMVMMMVAFYFTLVLGPELIIEVIVVSNFGFFGFLLATMASLGIGHIVLAGHRLVHDPKIDFQQPEAVKRESVMSHLFLGSRSFYKDIFFDKERLPQADKPEVRVGYTCTGRVFVVVCILVTAGMTVVGTFLNTFNFEFKGLVGLMLKDAADIEYGYVQVGNALPRASGEPNDFSVRWIQVCYYLFGLGMPLALLATLLFLWLVPLSLHRQRQVFILAEILNAWTALDVFCVSILAALMELQQFAAFIVGDSCDGINQVLTKFLDGPLEGDDKCFDVIAKLKPVSNYNSLVIPVFYSLFLACFYLIAFYCLLFVVFLELLDGVCCCWFAYLGRHSYVEDRSSRTGGTDGH